MLIPTFPQFSPLDFSMKEAISEYLTPLHDGLSDFLFYNLYFFRDYYDYQITKTEFGIVIKGRYESAPFFMVPSGKIPKDWLDAALKTLGVLSFISPSLIAENSELFHSTEYELVEDRNNFDYLYLRTELAALPGKKFHKKKNHVNQFKKSYSNISVKPLDAQTVDDAFAVLEKWREASQDEGDYKAAKEFLRYSDKTGLSGIVLYVGDVPVGWTAGEIYDNDEMAVIYFEKADISYQGSFQYLNYALANYLPENITYINREQDLGKPGLIKAKKTYNPVAFVKKYSLNFNSASPKIV